MTSPELDSSVRAATAASLPLTMRLGEFELTGILGEGGFSFVYTALDHSLGRTVAIKEYMPGAIATRLSDGSVVPKSLKHEETFRAGLASFINEARLLARFSHPALAHIHRVWEQNGTAYMAMQYCVGETLRQLSQSEPALVRDEKWLKALFTPILDALELLHAQNCFHRDISPDNILVLQNGRPVLLDFGAARQITGDVGQGFTVILRPGFAPIEQYADDSSLEQGPWTDVYGVGAVLYYLLMGKPPVASVARMVKDPMLRLADSTDLADISSSFRDAIDRALAVHPSQRIQSIAELREALQLPTFKPDEQAEKSPGTSIEIDKTAQAEVPPQGGIRDTADVELDSGAKAAYPSSVKIEPHFSPYHNLNTGIAAEAPKLNTTKGIKTFLGSLGVGHVALGIGLIVAALAILFALLDKPVTEPNQNSRIAANQAQGSVEDAPKPSPAVNPPTPSPADSQASTADSKESIPESPAAATSDNASEALPIHKTDKPRSVQKETEKPSSPAAAADEKTVADTATEPSAHVLAPIAPPASDAPPPAETTKPKTKRSLEAPSEQKPIAAATRLAPVSSSKAPSVRLFIKPWGHVAVDGQTQGVSPPLTRLTLPPGEHVVSITNGNFPPATIRITVPEKGEIVVSHRFGAR